MNTVISQLRTWLSTLSRTLSDLPVRIPGLRAVARSRATSNVQSRVRPPIIDHDWVPSPTIIAVGLMLMMATAVAAACSAVYPAQPAISGINAHADSEYADGAGHRRLRRMR